MAKTMVLNTEITLLSHNDKDYISLTNMANGKQSNSWATDIIIKIAYVQDIPLVYWLLGDDTRIQAVLLSFVMSISEWIDYTEQKACTTQPDCYSPCARIGD